MVAPTPSTNRSIGAHVKVTLRLLTALAVGVFALVVPGPAYAATGTNFSGTYYSWEGNRSYHGYVPSTYQPGTAVPLVVALHGCGHDGYTYETRTNWSTLAEQKGFIVVYPNQAFLANLLMCWNWGQSGNQHRGKGEPSIIAGITNWVRDHYSVDSKRIYVTGMSAGGVMANIISVTYPDIYAAQSVVAGCEYMCDTNAVMTPQQSGQYALTEMGTRARAVPTILWQGTADTIVPPSTAYRIVGQWATVDGIDDIADITVNGQVFNGRTYTQTIYTDATNNDLIQLYMTDGEGHQYPGGCSCDPKSDPTGPDATGLSWRFFESHPMP